MAVVNKLACLEKVYLRGVRKLSGENFEVVGAEFSTLS
jgi:hypothetical protein